MLAQNRVRKPVTRTKKSCTKVQDFAFLYLRKGYLEMKPIEIIANGIGLVAITLYVLGYLQKTRKNIILVSVISKVLYVLQYILLGAISGAILDIVGALSSILAERKNKIGFIKKHTVLFVVIMDSLMIAGGAVLFFVFGDKYAIFSTLGVLLHTSAFWIDDEKKIRKLSFCGSPFWFIYNFMSKAYSCCIGDLLSMVSIVTSMIRYGDFKKNKDN